jgi:hypothetical protein
MIMKRHVLMVLASTVVCGPAALTGQATPPPVPQRLSLVDAAVGDSLPPDFADRTFEHIEYLAALGPRRVGTEAEIETIQYLTRQFETMGLETRVEWFEFESYRIERVVVTLCDRAVEPVTIGFNPYTGRETFGGRPVFVGPDMSQEQLGRLDLRDRIVITTAPVSYFSLVYQNPLLIVYLSNSDYRALADESCGTCALTVDGSVETHRSANVVAELQLSPNTGNDEEVILSAHWDSYRDSPGADDNASGVGVLLELARYFSMLKNAPGGTIKFVSFGAEELGMVGSRVYLTEHQADLADCALVINLDQVGGPTGPTVELTGGVRGVPVRKGATQFPALLRNRAFEGLDGRWRITSPQLMDVMIAANRPPWLEAAVTTSAAELDIDILPTDNLGSDQQVFTQAGIVATGVGSAGNQYHSPADLPGQINKGGLEAAGKLVANVVLIRLTAGM